jgi:hypothetical protein
VSPSFAYAYESFSGGSGLIEMRTADVVESGSLDIDLYGLVKAYRKPGSSNKDSDGVAALGLNYGIANVMELGIIVPYEVYGDSSITGWRDVEGVAKVRVLGDPQKGYGLAVTGFGTLDTSSTAKNLGSGKRQYGGEMNFSIFGKTSSFHVTGGYQKSDTKHVSSSLVDYTREEKLVGGVGVEIRPIPEFVFSLEALADHGMHSKGDDTFLAPGVRYSPNDYLTYTVGASIGLPDDRSEPRYEIMAGITIGLGRTKGKVVPVDSRMTDAEKRLQSLEAKLDQTVQEWDRKLGQLQVEVKENSEAQQRAKMKEEISSLESRVSTLERSNRTGAIGSSSSGTAPVTASRAVPGEKQGKTGGKRAPRIEVLNGTTIPGMAQKVAERLRKKGYSIVRVGDAEKKNAAVSTVYYREGYAENAVTTGHAIPRDQYVFKKPGIASDIDIQIVIGSDLKNIK